MEEKIDVEQACTFKSFPHPFTGRIVSLNYQDAARHRLTEGLRSIWELLARKRVCMPSSSSRFAEDNIHIVTWA